MEEKIIISGRNLHNIDPDLGVWHFPIAFYLFLGGLAAGILIFSAITVILDKQDKLPSSARIAPLAVPILLSIGLLALIIDLTHKLYVWQLYMTIRIESPMSWGAWVLLVVTPLSFLWAFADLRKVFPKIDWKFSILYKLETLINDYRKPLAWVLIPLCVILGIYTGILLSAFNARPLWNTSILGPLFLTSGLSTAAAAIILFAKTEYEKHLISKIDILLIIIELALIIHFVMTFYAGNESQIEAINILLSGNYAVLFFGVLLGFGLLLPLVLEVFELWGVKIPTYIPAVLILIGGLIFRMLVTDAGQFSHILY